MNKRTSLFNQIARFILVFLIVLAMQGAMPPQPAQAFTLLVTNTNDSGAGSLRQAVLDASAVTTETIGFDWSLDGATITLFSEISITKDLKIQGLSNTNQRIQISGNNSTRVFSIASGADVWINSLDIVDGNDVFGAGIANSGELLITDCAFDGNHATNFGGAIYNDGDLTMTSCTVTNNSAGLDGGAMYTSGASAGLRLQKSTFTGNHAGRDGGGFIMASGR